MKIKRAETFLMQTAIRNLVEFVLVALDYCVWCNKGWSLLQVLVFRNPLKPNSLNLAVFENCAVLGYYATYNGNSVPTFRDNFPETSVRNYHYTVRNNPEERSSHLPRGGSLKSHGVYWYTRVFRYVTRRCSSSTGERISVN